MISTGFYKKYMKEKNYFFSFKYAHKFIIYLKRLKDKCLKVKLLNENYLMHTRMPKCKILWNDLNKQMSSFNILKSKFDQDKEK